MAKTQFRIDRKTGKPVGLPFLYDYDLSTFGGDEEALAEDLQREQDEFDRIAQHLPPGSPHPMAFRDRQNDAAYQGALKAWEVNENEGRTARATVNALAAHHQATRPAPVIDWDFLSATHSPHAEDVQRGKDRLSTRALVRELRDKAERAERVGNIARARELHDMADYQERCKDIRDKGSYSFEREYDQKLASDAEATLKAAEGAGWITGDAEQYRALCAARNHECLEDNSFHVRMSQDNSRFQIVNLEHAGHKARNVCLAGGEDFLPSLMALHFPEGSEERESAEPAPEPETNSDDKWGSQAEFEAERVANGAPHT